MASIKLSLAKAYIVQERLSKLLKQKESELRKNSAESFKEVDYINWSKKSDTILQRFNQKIQKIEILQKDIIQIIETEFKIRKDLGKANSQFGISDLLAEIRKIDGEIDFNESILNLIDTDSFSSNSFLIEETVAETLNPKIEYINSIADEEQKMKIKDKMLPIKVVLFKEQQIEATRNKIEELELQRTALLDKISELNHTNFINVEIPEDIAKATSL